jgi:hypothetical protein
VTGRDDHGVRPIHYGGVHRDNVQFLRTLLDRGADIDQGARSDALKALLR